MRIFTVPPDVPFLEALARAILGGGFPEPGRPAPGPIELARWRVLLPTRRSKTALRDAFFRAAPGAARLLLRIGVLGALDEDDEGDHEEPRDEIEVPDAVGDFERRFLLTQLINEWAVKHPHTALAGNVGTNPTQALALAESLGELVNSFDIEDVPLDAVAALFGEELAAHQRDALAFLNILREGYPEGLKSRGKIGPQQRRAQLIDREAARLAETPPPHPIIAAGSTGSIPATARLLATIAGLPNGAVVLPGLDQELDKESFDALAPQDAQYGLKLLLEHVGVERGSVRLLPGVRRMAGGGMARIKLLSEAMRPAVTTDRWREVVARDAAVLKAGTAGLRRVAAPDQRLEAAAIALVMRKVAGERDRTVSLVTPDRNLARRVKTELMRWNLEVANSAGEPLSHSMQGSLAALVLGAALPAADPEQLVALLQHPAACFGRQRSFVSFASQLLEIGVLRGLRKSGGVSGLAAAIEQRIAALAANNHAHRLVNLMREEDWDMVRQLVRHIDEAVNRLSQLLVSDKPVPLLALVAAHQAAIEATLRCEDTASAERFWAEPGGVALVRLMGEIEIAGAGAPALRGSDYQSFFEKAQKSVAVRAGASGGDRLRILGLLEARLIASDVMILAGLNERVWPREPDTDPWLNRPERQKLGLQTPERRIGLTAHDFSQCAAAPETWLFLSRKIAGHPAVASQFVLRLEALLGAAGLLDALEPEENWVGYALGLDAAPHHVPISQPEPRPDVALRPSRLSVTGIDTLIRDPYALFARRILKLEELEPLWREAGPAERGTLIHSALNAFVQAHSDLLPDNATQVMVAFADGLIDDESVGIAQAAFWRQEFRRIAEWFAEEEVNLRATARKLHTELKGSTLLELIDGSQFQLTARADRIDEKRDGTLRIIDYKTGTPPSFSETAGNFSPQLLLEALIANRGGFDGLQPAEVSELIYFRLSGRGQEAGEKKSVLSEAVARQVQSVEQGLGRLLSSYRSAAQAYCAVLQANGQWRDPYGHLSRWREWIHAPPASGRANGDAGSNA